MTRVSLICHRLCVAIVCVAGCGQGSSTSPGSSTPAPTGTVGSFPEMDGGTVMDSAAMDSASASDSATGHTNSDSSTPGANICTSIGADDGGPAAASTAALAYDAWNAAFLELNNGHPYYANQETSVGHTIARMYTGALDLAVAEDVYQQTHSQSQRDLIVSLIDTYLLDNVATSSGTQGENGTNWSYDGWNDDIGWMTNALLRGYQYTGIAEYLTVAESNWNMGYNRGWDDTLGGGIYENDTRDGKEALSNNPFVWEGVILYQLTGDAAYLTKAKAIYAWVRTHLVNTTNGANSLGAPGQVNQGMNKDGTLSPGDNVYNEGAFVAAATALYRLTGDQSYYDDAVRTITRVIAKQPILTNNQEHCGCQWAYWFTYGLSQFATIANLWSQYLPYLQKNADAAWSKRNARNLTWNEWTAATSNAVVAGDPDEVEMQSAVAIWQHLPPPSVDLSCTYEIESAASGLAMTVDATVDSMAKGTAVIQSPFASGSANALWTLVPTSGGYYQIRNVNSGLVVNVSAASALSGAKLVQWSAQRMLPGNDQWLPVQNADGTYSFYNLNSLQALNASGASGSQLDQGFGNSSTAQKFRLVPRP